MLLDTVKALCALNGPASFEDDVRDYLRNRAIKAGAEVKTDRMGNLICFKRGEGETSRKLMLCAHMDEVGLIVKRITEEGYLKFGCLGSIDRRVLIGKPVFVGANRIPGVIGLKAVHLTTPEERKVTPKTEELYIDIGARDRADAEAMTFLGDFVVFSDSVTEFGSGMLKAKALDSRTGCGVLMELMERPLPMDCTFVFTVQENVGMRGAFGATFSVKPDLALVVGGIPAADLPTADKHKRVCVPGSGPVIPYMDHGAVYDRGIFELLRALAEENHIPWQAGEYITAGNDSAAIQRTRTGVPTGALAAPVRYLNTPSCVAAVRDLERVEALAFRFVEAVARGRI